MSDDDSFTAETRDKALEASKEHWAAVQQQFPECDTSESAAVMATLIELQFEIKNTVPDDVYRQMRECLGPTDEAEADDSEEAVRSSMEATRNCLEGYAQLQQRWDALMAESGEVSLKLVNCMCSSKSAESARNE